MSAAPAVIQVCTKWHQITNTEERIAELESKIGQLEAGLHQPRKARKN